MKFWLIRAGESFELIYFRTPIHRQILLLVVIFFLIVHIWEYEFFINLIFLEVEEINVSTLAENFAKHHFEIRIKNLFLSGFELFITFHVCMARYRVYISSEKLLSSYSRTWSVFRVDKSSLAIWITSRFTIVEVVLVSATRLHFCFFTVTRLTMLTWGWSMRYKYIPGDG